MDTNNRSRAVGALGTVSVHGAALLLAACAAASGPIEVPAAIATAPRQALVLSVAATGVQIYECRTGVADGTATRSPQWAFVAPEAVLFDASGRRVGQHGAGPHWAFDDGTRVTGRVAARADAPRAGAIPWLLLEAQATPPGGQDSRLGELRSIQRIHTAGGVAPSDGCQAQDVGHRVRVPYTADYLFYSGAR